MFSAWSTLSAGLLDSPILARFDVIPWSRWPFFILLCSLILIQLLRGKSGTPLVRLIQEVLIVVPAYFLYFLVRGVVEGREAEALARATRLVELEQALKIFWEPILQAYILPFDFLVTLANWVYIWGHWPVIVFAALWLFFLHRESYAVYRNAFLISGAVGLVIFTLYPVAPPRFMDGLGFIDTVTENSKAYRVLQPPAFVNQFAAMPSLHFGWNLIVGIAIYRHASNRFVKAIGILLPFLMLSAIVLTANHFIIDAVAGGALALLGLLLAIFLHRHFGVETPRVETQPPLRPQRAA